MTTRTNQPITQRDLQRAHKQGIKRCFEEVRAAANGGRARHCACSICKLVSEIEKQGVIKNAPITRRDLQRAHREGMKRCFEEVRDAANGVHARHCECVVCKLISQVEKQAVLKMQTAAQNLVVEEVPVGKVPDTDAALDWILSNLEKVDDKTTTLPTDELWDAVKERAKAALTFHDGGRPLAYGKSRRWYSRKVMTVFSLPSARVQAGTRGRGREIVGVRLRV